MINMDTSSGLTPTCAVANLAGANQGHHYAAIHVHAKFDSQTLLWTFMLKVTYQSFEQAQPHVTTLQLTQQLAELTYCPQIG
jgi:hypothetical protein